MTSFTGVVIVLDPRKLFEIFWTGQSDEKAYFEQLCAFGMLLASITWAYSVILVRRVPTVDACTLTFYQGVVMAAHGGA